MEQKNCPICKKTFFVFPYQIKKGIGRFCSRTCFGVSRKGILPSYHFPKGHVPWIKGRGMNEEEKIKQRKITLKKYNNNPSRKVVVAKWHLDHKDRIKEIKQKYANSERGRLIQKIDGQRRIEREKNLKKKMNWDYWRWLCEKLDYHCQGCGKKFDIFSLTVDHMVPINRGGDNDDWNIQPLCKPCNSRKQDRLIWLENVKLDILYGDWLLEQRRMYG